jgi:hypothetical protein
MGKRWQAGLGSPVGDGHGQRTAEPAQAYLMLATRLESYSGHAGPVISVQVVRTLAHHHGAGLHT